MEIPTFPLNFPVLLSTGEARNYVSSRNVEIWCTLFLHLSSHSPTGSASKRDIPEVAWKVLTRPQQIMRAPLIRVAILLQTHVWSIVKGSIAKSVKPRTHSMQDLPVQKWDKKQAIWMAHGDITQYEVRNVFVALWRHLIGAWLCCRDLQPPSLSPQPIIIRFCV